MQIFARSIPLWELHVKVITRSNFGLLNSTKTLHLAPTKEWTWEKFGLANGLLTSIGEWVYIYLDRATDSVIKTVFQRDRLTIELTVELS